ncbi:hypothetical protein MVEG_02476 [Podila verticillata NRRL 6337]|nr:hypothetical protein MVEG_02476 [Podila verticillata NRRL 6337]
MSASSRTGRFSSETTESRPTPKSPFVLISGAGLGGLTMALLLEQAKINYAVFERAVKVKPLGACIALSPNILPIFQQLGLLDELLSICMPGKDLDIYRENMTRIGGVEGQYYKDITGYDTVFFWRPDLYDWLLSKIPASKIHMSKKILAVQQSDEGVKIRCSDNTGYTGDILIGADGAYSGVRQSLYKQLDQQGILPEEDRKEMPMTYVCMVGTTKSLDPEKYPELKDPHSHFSTVLGKSKPHSWTTVTLRDKKISWGVMLQLSQEASADMMFRNSEWGPEANRSMLDEVYNFPIKNGGVLGDLIDATDKDLISKVYIEEKLFQTWNHGRIALMGDAVHKMQPSAGQGAVSAMQDAVVLASCLYDVEEATQNNIEAALADYRAQRIGHVTVQVNMSKMMGKAMFGQKWTERLMRNIMYNMPKWLQNKAHLQAATYRPNIAFLPPVPNTTNLKLEPQKPSKRYMREQAERAKVASMVSMVSSTVAV